jgi:hypothetical protein
MRRRDQRWLQVYEESAEASIAGLLRVYIDKRIVMAIGCRDIDTVARRTADTETNK